METFLLIGITIVAAIWIIRKENKKLKNTSRLHKMCIRDSVRAVYYDSLQQVLWLGIHLKGLNRLDMKTGHFTQYKNKKGDSSSLPSNLVEDIIPYQKQLILATANGVTLFNPQTGKCKLLFQDKNALYNTISTIGLTLDHEGTLWIANNNKMCIRDR